MLVYEVRSSVDGLVPTMRTFTFQRLKIRLDGEEITRSILVDNCAMDKWLATINTTHTPGCHRATLVHRTLIGVVGYTRQTVCEIKVSSAI
jgi:hypothetical protein